MKKEVYLDESEDCGDYLQVATGHLFAGFQINSGEIVLIDREEGQKLFQQLQDWLK